MKDSLAQSNVDFSAALATLGITSRAIDSDSPRIFELDGSGNIIGEKQARTEFQSYTTARVTWLIDGTTPEGATRNFAVYFDTTDHGPKAPSQNTKLRMNGRLIAFTDDSGKIYTIESNGDGTLGTANLIDDISTANEANIRGVVLDDFNNDGFADIITGRGTTGELYYYQNKADGTNTFLSRVKVGVITASSWIMDLASRGFQQRRHNGFCRERQQ